MSRRISYNTPNPQRYFSWGKTCPECNSKDIRMRENPNHPMWKCRNCGAEFDSSKSDTKRIDGHNCAFYGDQENCPVPYDEPVNCGLFHLCETVTTQNKHTKRT